MAAESALTPMLVQYLIGLCCARWNSDAVDVTIGEMVIDSAAGKTRDVDVTVTVNDAETGKYAFKPYEVKHEGTSLDVSEVEQLCMKFQDMGNVTHCAIVSTSGFSDSAQEKAKAHGVDLYQLIPWKKPLQEQFPFITMKGTPQECFPSHQLLLTWTRFQISVVAPTAQGPFQVDADASVYDAEGLPHKRYETFDEWRRALLFRSTNTLHAFEHPQRMLFAFPVPYHSWDDAEAPAWPHTHTLDVAADEVYVEVSGKWCRVETGTISGFLQWQRGPASMYYLMSKVPNDQPFADALVAVGRQEGEMKALLFSPITQDIAVRFIQFSQDHLNSIQKLKLVDSS
jgi:Restriction endonuclease